MDFDPYHRELAEFAAFLRLPWQADGEGLDRFLPFVERIRAEGGVFLIKFDGERVRPGDTGQYTTVVSGVPLEGETFRIDAWNLADAMAFAIVSWGRFRWR